jgi:hypothetical protein
VQVYQATLSFSLNEDTQTFPNIVFNEPPAAITCWEQLSDKRYRLVVPRAVHWDPTRDTPNLTITSTSARAVLVSVTIDDGAAQSSDERAP